MVPSLRTKLGVLATLFHLSNIYVASGQFCGCSSLVIPVHVDVLIPKDPADPFGGLKSNASSLRRLNETYDIFGVFCQPNTAVSPEKAGVIQLLVHGFTYTSQYWSPQTEEFRNYSYTEFACDRGLSSLAIDLVGVGLSSRPANASDVQYATNAAVVSQLARHLKITSIIAGVQPFKKVIAIGHSAGSATLTFGATAEGGHSPFDGFILTGNVNVRPGTLPQLPGIMSARDDTPAPVGRPRPQLHHHKQSQPILPHKPQLLLAPHGHIRRLNEGRWAFILAVTGQCDFFADAVPPGPWRRLWAQRTKCFASLAIVWTWWL
ncbi:hypothetical protein C8J57DRAFT_1668535 [Mycena rebaudengoi]|nr:hypothetical protein C8J57DRAFT_1668535 [Mycena rebaudengoi]